MVAPGGAMQLPGPHRPALAGVRAAIDAIDTLQLALLGMRGRLAVRAGRAKHFAGLPGSDPEREARVRERALRLAERFGVEPGTAGALRSEERRVGKECRDRRAVWNDNNAKAEQAPTA